MAPSVVSLYSGAGGLDLGFKQAGFELLWANDFEKHAVATYNLNIGNHAVCGDVLTTPLPAVSPDVVIGGPPCQGFSVIGHMKAEDPRSQHVQYFLDVVARLRPRAFVMENVKALGASPRWEPIREALKKRARALGYTVRLEVLNSAHYGVPQARERMFLIGVKGDSVPQMPIATTADAPMTVRDALALLPRFGEPGNDIGSTARVTPSQYPVMRPTAYRGTLLFNGSGRPFDLDQPAKTLPASMGGNATPILDQLEIDTGAPAWVVQYHQHLRDGGAPATETPSRLRRVTVQEAAVLQSFPVDFTFTGPKGMQYRQIGNAVPPGLGRAVAESVMRTLEAAAPQATAEQLAIA